MLRLLCAVLMVCTVYTTSHNTVRALRGQAKSWVTGDQTLLLFS
jgi:hypothetical protein